MKRPTYKVETPGEKLLQKTAKAVLGTGSFIEKAIIGGSTALGLYNAASISHKLANFTGIEQFCHDNPHTAIVLGTITSAILANLAGRIVVGGSKLGYEKLTKKRNMINRPGVGTVVVGSPVSPDIDNDITVEKEILDTKIRNVEDAIYNINLIASKIQEMENNLKLAEKNIDDHINRNDAKSTNEIHAHYAGDDAMTDFNDDGTLSQHQDHYLTTKDSSTLLAHTDNKKRKEIIEHLLPKVLYRYDGSSDQFISDSKYYIGNTEIQGWLNDLETILVALESEKPNLSNRARATNTSLITINQINERLKPGGKTNTILQEALQHITSLGLSNIKKKKRPAQLTLTKETEILQKNIKNTEKTNKSYRDKIRHII